MNSGSNSRRFAALFLAWVAPVSGALASPFEGKPIASVVVECQDPQVLSRAERIFPEALLGDFSSDVAAETVRRFFAEQEVYAVSISGEEREGRAHLTVNVDVRPVITSIQIRGARSLRKKELREQVDLARGDRAVPASLERIRTRLTEYLFYRGFPRAEVSVDLRVGDDPREGTVRIGVREGVPCTLSDLEIVSTSQSLTPKEGGKLLRMEVGDRCDGRKLVEGAGRIEKKLRERGRLSAKVEEPELTYRPDRERAGAVLRVSPGPRFDVRFEGNSFSFERDSLLKKAIFFDDERQFNQGWLDATAKEGIRRFYVSQGYPDAKVEVSDSLDEGADLRSIRFRIERGKILRIGRLQFRGNSKIGSRDLERHFWAVAPARTRQRILVRDELTPILDAFVAFYQQNGFLRAKISPPVVTIRRDDGRADLLFGIDEGNDSRLRTYVVSGNRAIPSEELEEMMRVKGGRPVDPVLLREGADLAEERYRRLGYKFAKVHLPSVERIPEGGVDYEVRVEEGPKVSIGDVRVRGILDTKEYVVRRELTFKKGDPYDPAKLTESRRKLLRLGFFQSVTIDELPFDPKTGTEEIVVTVSERKKGYLALRPGFSTDEGYRLTGDLRYMNIAGTGRSATASGSVSRQIDDPDIVEHRVYLTYLEPHLLGVVNGKVNYIDERTEEVQYDIDRRGVIVGADRDILRWLRGTLQWELEYRNPFNVEPGAVLSPIDATAARFGSIASILDFDFRDDPLNARKGSFHRLQASLYDNALASEADFWQVYLKDSFYVPIYRRIRTVLSVRVGFSATYGQTGSQGITEVPIEKRFRLGGNNSLRGFGRNCVGGVTTGAAENCSDTASNEAPGGNAVFNYMFDLLLPLFGGLDLALFTDGGNAYLSNGDFDLTDIRTTAGVGLRYNTFFGPLRLDYGIKLDRRTGESFGEFHFAVGQF